MTKNRIISHDVKHCFQQRKISLFSNIAKRTHKQKQTCSNLHSNLHASIFGKSSWNEMGIVRLRVTYALCSPECRLRVHPFNCGLILKPRDRSNTITYITRTVQACACGLLLLQLINSCRTSKACSLRLNLQLWNSSTTFSIPPTCQLTLPQLSFPPYLSI